MSTPPARRAPQPATEHAARQAAQPASEHAARQATQPASEHAARQATRQAAEHAAQPATQRATSGTGRRAGRRKTEVLQAAVRVLAERGAEGTRFQDVSAASGVPVSTLQYYFGSREDLLIAAFKHASETETVLLHEELAQVPDPWERLVRIIETVLDGCRPEAPEGGRLWIESWRYGMRDVEMRQDVLRDYEAWRTLIADAIQAGLDAGSFATGDPEPDAIVILSLLDGIGLPTALGDPAVSPERARELMLATMGRLLRPSR